MNINIVQLDEKEAEVDPIIAKEMDKLITDLWMTGQEDLIPQICHYILAENVSGMFQKSLDFKNIFRLTL